MNYSFASVSAAPRRDTSWTYFYFDLSILAALKTGSQVLLDRLCFGFWLTCAVFEVQPQRCRPSRSVQGSDPSGYRSWRPIGPKVFVFFYVYDASRLLKLSVDLKIINKTSICLI